LSQESQVFKARIIGGLSIKQLMRIFELEEYSYSEYEIGMMLKKAITVFRDKHYPDADDFGFSEHAKSVYNNQGNHVIKQCIEDYCKLASQDRLSQKDLDRLEEITDQARHHAYLDTFINEIDYGIAQENELNHDLIYKQFIQRFEQVLEEKKQEIQAKLRSCQTKTMEFWGSLEEFVKQEINKEISVNELLKQEPEISKYEAVFTGTTVKVKTFFDYLKEGKSINDFIAEFPTVTKEQAIALLEKAEK
jgi:uncharacterized protein (DUF433 family)